MIQGLTEFWRNDRGQIQPTNLVRGPSIQVTTGVGRWMTIPTACKDPEVLIAFFVLLLASRSLSTIAEGVNSSSNARSFFAVGILTAFTPSPNLTDLGLSDGTT